MEARLPPDKFSRIHNQLSSWLTRKKATKREVLSFVRLLQHTAKVVKPGRSFMSRTYSIYCSQTETFLPLHVPALTKTSDQTYTGGILLSIAEMGQAFSTLPSIIPLCVCMRVCACTHALVLC